jgi:hypothetical protein
MSIFSIVYAVIDAHSVLGAVAGSVVTVSSQKVSAWVSKQSASAKAAVLAETAKAAAEIKKVA